MPAVIKKGKCEYIPLHVPESMQDNEHENKENASFDHLANLVAQDSNEETGQSGFEEEAIDPAKIVEDARQEARRILEEARIKAGAIIDDANTDAIRIRAEADEIIAEARKFAEEESAKAYEKGFEQGKRDGEDLGQRKFNTRLQSLKKLVSNISGQAEQLVFEHERQIINLVLEIARKVVDHEIETNPEIISRCIRSAMTLVVSGSSITIRINPSDMEHLSDSLQNIEEAQRGIEVNFKEDPAIERGGCLIETGFGLVDATTKGRWQAVSDEIRKILTEKTGNIRQSLDSDNDQSCETGDDLEGEKPEAPQPESQAQEAAGDGIVSGEGKDNV